MFQVFRLRRSQAGTKQGRDLSPVRLIALSEPPLKAPAPTDELAEAEQAPRRKRKPVGWSMIFIGVLVAVSATLVYRRDGINGVLDILTHDLTLFGGILPRVLAGCLLGAFIAMVVSWTLIGYGRAVAWELPILGTDFTMWRAIISLPIPVLAGALGRLVYVRMYPK